MKQVTVVRKKRTVRNKANKELSIQEISPQWARIIPLTPKTEQQQFYKKDRVLDISDAKSCIVGEAYGFKDDYFNSGEDFCRDCFAHSVEFGSLLMENPVNREIPVQNFVDHWNSTHV